MSDPSALDDIGYELLLNGMPMRSVRIRQTTEVGDFDVVVADPMLGCFALHSGFEIDLHDPDCGWRRVSFEELKATLKRTNLQPVDDLPKASEIAGSHLFARVNDIEIPHWECGLLSVLGREDACIRYVQRIFYRVGIPHLVAGTTFSVPSVRTARIPLRRAGFRRSTISPSALVEPCTNVTVQLIERDPNK